MGNRINGCAIAGDRHPLFVDAGRGVARVAVEDDHNHYLNAILLSSQFRGVNMPNKFTDEQNLADDDAQKAAESEKKANKAASDAGKVTAPNDDVGLEHESDVMGAK
jgi:hypothetical protein